MIPEFRVSEEVHLSRYARKFWFYPSRRQTSRSRFPARCVMLRKPHEVYLKDIAQFINIDVLYGIDTGKSECDIEYWTDKYFDELLENTIIIGDSLQHGFIVMICAGENAGVYYYDDSYYFEESNDEGNVYWIAENFEEFWKMLKNY